MHAEHAELPVLTGPRITLRPLENTYAIQAYEKAGFKPVGTLRRYERIDNGEWRDALLMDLLAKEIPPEPVE